MFTKTQILFLILLIPCALFGQNTEEQIAKLRSIFNQLSYVNRGVSHSHPEVLLAKLIVLKDTTFQSEFPYNDYYEAQRAYSKKQLGLNLRADAMQNSKTIFSDVEDNILYQRRYLVGLEWDLLKNGLLERKYSLENSLIDEDIQKLKSVNTIPLKTSLPRSTCIFYFNEQKIPILLKRDSLLTESLKYLENLVYSKEITLDDYFSAKARLQESKAQLKMYRGFNSQMKSTTSVNLLNNSATVYEINDSLYQNYLSNTVQTDTATLNQLMQKRIENSNQWYTQLSLRAYTRLNTYDLYDPSNPYRSFFSFGINVQTPLPFSHKEKANLERLTYQKSNFHLEPSINERKLELMNNAYEYHYALKQYINLLQRIELTKNTIRIERTKKQLNVADFNAIKGLRLWDDYLQMELELLEVQQVLYLKLIDIQEKMPNTNLNWLSPLDESTLQLESKQMKSVYVWSKTFENDPNLLSAFVEYNHFSTCFVAATKEDSLIAQKKKFAENCSAVAVEIIPMIGQNKLLSSTDISKDLNEILKDFKKAKINYSEIHLDVEPHTFDSWKEKKDSLKLAYLNLLKEAKTYCNNENLKLSISIPINYDSTFVYECLKFVDEIHFMCYENVKFDYLKRKLQSYNPVMNQIHIALRTEDFENRSALEAYFAMINSELGFRQANYHDLKRLIDWDKKQLNEER